MSDWVVWGALLFAICSGIAGIVLLLGRVRELVRIVKRTRSSAVASLGALTAKAELTATKAEAAGDAVELRATVARLRRSLAQLAVLRKAIAEVEEKLWWVRVLL